MLLCCSEAKQPNLKLKTLSKQLLGHLPLDIDLAQSIDNEYNISLVCIDCAKAGGHDIQWG
jgi:hypothetical protein